MAVRDAWVLSDEQLEGCGCFASARAFSAWRQGTG